MESLSQIIVVEDNLYDFELITHALRQAGFQFAARRVNSQQELDEELFRLSPDLVLCDHAGSNWSSFSVLQQVRAFEPTMPFVVVSGAIDDKTRQTMRNRGVDDCISKDRLTELPEAMRRVLQAHEMQRRQRVDEIRRTSMPWEPPAPPAALANN